MRNTYLTLLLLLGTFVLAGCERQVTALDETRPTQGDAAGSFPSDEELLRQTLSASEDWHSPGADLPPGLRLVVQQLDNSIQYVVSPDGASAVLVAAAPASLLPAGFDSIPMADGPEVFKRPMDRPIPGPSPCLGVGAGERQGDQLFLTKQPVDGMGGFHPFVNAVNLWVYSLQDGSSTELVSDTVTGGKLCLDAILPDDRLLAHHCDSGQITLLDLEIGETTAVRLPAQVTGDAYLGSLRFSPKTESKNRFLARCSNRVGAVKFYHGF